MSVPLLKIPARLMNRLNWWNLELPNTANRAQGRLPPLTNRDFQIKTDRSDFGPSTTTTTMATVKTIQWRTVGSKTKNRKSEEQQIYSEFFITGSTSSRSCLFNPVFVTAKGCNKLPDTTTPCWSNCRLGMLLGLHFGSHQRRQGDGKQWGRNP